MSKAARSPRAVLDGWRAQGADRRDPVRFYAMDALAHRAAACDGELQRVLHERLAILIDDYTMRLAQTPAGASTADKPPAHPLRELVDQLALHATARAHDDATSAVFPQLPALEEFRQRWGTLRSESHLRQSMKQAPANAGPLNSAALVHRAIAVMRELSPGYLQHFLSYVDHLSWLAQLDTRPATPARDASEPAAPRKRSRARARTPRE